MGDADGWRLFHEWDSEREAGMESQQGRKGRDRLSGMMFQGTKVT